MTTKSKRKEAAGQYQSQLEPTPAELTFLRVLVVEGPARPGWLGSVTYGGHRNPQTYARPAANVLWRLERKGLARRITWLSRWPVWEATERGREVAHG